MSYAVFPAEFERQTGAVQIGISDGHHVDAFSRLRTSNPDTVFDSSLQYDLQPLIFEAVVANNGTVVHTPTSSGATLSVTTTAGSTAALQSKQYHRYIPGKSQLIVMTLAFGTATANVRKRAGYFDSNNGVYFEQNGTTDVAWVVRSDVSGSVVNNRVVQANWNIDTFDGSGNQANPSGLTLDSSKAQILTMDLQWLGMGRVRVAFDIDGVVYPAHNFNHANSLSVPYMRTANLPLRYEITNLAAAAGSMLGVCTSVQSEGGADRFLSYHFGYHRASVTAGSGTQTYAFSIRPKVTFNSITNRMLIRPTAFDCLVTGMNPVLVEIYYGTAVGGTPSWTDMNTTYSGLQVDTAGTPSGGFLVNSIPINATATAKEAISQLFIARYPLVLDVAGTGFNHFTIYVTGLGGTSACIPGITWEEVR